MILKPDVGNSIFDMDSSEKITAAAVEAYGFLLKSDPSICTNIIKADSLFSSLYFSTLSSFHPSDHLTTTLNISTSC